MSGNSVYYDRLMLEVMDPTLVYYQFGQKKSLPKSEGNSVIWNRPTRLALGFTLSEGVPTSTANALSTTKVSAILSQYGGFTAVSDLVSLTSITEPMKLAAERLGKQASETLERVITSNICGHASTTANSTHSYGKTSTTLYEYWGLTSTARNPVSSTNVIAVSDIRTVIYGLKKLDVEPYSGNDYVAIVHPEISEDIVSDSTWINFHQYAAPGQNSLYTGEIGWHKIIKKLVRHLADLLNPLNSVNLASC